MAYTKTVYVNDNPPALNADNLNKMEQGIYDNDAAITDTNSELDNSIKNTNTEIDAINNGLEIEYPKNLCNPNGWLNGILIQADTGKLIFNSSFKTSNIIKCSANDVLYLTGVTTGNAYIGPGATNMRRIAFYDISGNVISISDYANSITCPANTYCCRFTLSSAVTSTYCLSRNWYPTGVSDFAYYSAPTYKINKYIENLEVFREETEEEIVGIQEGLDYRQSANLCNPDEIISGYVIKVNGSVQANADYTTSGMMECKPSDIVYLTMLTSNNIFMGKNDVSFFRIAFYDENNDFISYINSTNSVTVPANAKKFRFSLYGGNITSTICITLNSYPTSRETFIVYFEPYYNLENRVAALEENDPYPVLELTTIDCWGDSMTEGGSAGKSYPQLLGELLGNRFTVNNYGKSSQASGEIAFRFGSNDVWIKLQGNEIPATTDAVTVEEIYCSTGAKFSRRNFGNFAAGGYVNCNLQGVPGQLNVLVGVGKTFKRNTAGDVVSVPGLCKIFNDENFSSENMCIFWAGKNDTAMADTYTVNGTVDNIYGMTRKMQHNQFIVLPVFKSLTETRGTTGYNNITAINNKLATLYPSNFLDIQAMLIEHGLEDAGITPTSADETAIANDTMPPSLMASDGVHPNEEAREVYVVYIKDFMHQKGWIA